MAVKLGRPLKPEEFVRHSCGVPSCCSPEHLTIGTQQQNINDRTKRGRTRGAAFKIEMLPTALKMRAAGATLQSIGEAIGVHKKTICNWLIAAGHRTNRPTAVPPEIVAKRVRCRELWAAGVHTQAEICREIEASAGFVSTWTREDK